MATIAMPARPSFPANCIGAGSVYCTNTLTPPRWPPRAARCSNPRSERRQKVPDPATRSNINMTRRRCCRGSRTSPKMFAISSTSHKVIATPVNRTKPLLNTRSAPAWQLGRGGVAILARSGSADRAVRATPRRNRTSVSSRIR